MLECLILYDSGVRSTDYLSSALPVLGKYYPHLKMLFIKNLVSESPQLQSQIELYIRLDYIIRFGFSHPNEIVHLLLVAESEFQLKMIVLGICYIPNTQD